MDGYVTLANDAAARWAGVVWPAIWQSTILAAALLLLTRLLKRAPAALRYWLWMLVPLRLLVMPLLSIPLPVLPGPSPEMAVRAPEIMSSGVTEGASVALWREPPFPFVPVTSAAPMTSHVEEARPQAGLLVYVLLAWGAGVLLLSIRMARAWRWTRRLVAAGKTVTDGRLADAACKAAGMLGLRRLPRLVVTDARVSPFTCGVRRPVVVLPRAFVQQVDDHCLLAVLAHEFAHLRRYDSLFGIILGLCHALYFLHPVVHWVERQIFFERERACDDLVLLTSRARPSAYANAICAAAKFSRNARPLTSPPALVAESFGELTGRLTALASRGTRRARLSKLSLVSLVTLGALCVPGITLTPAEPTGSASPAPLCAAAGQRAADTDRRPVTLAALADDETPTERERAGTRVIHFPEDHALGVVSVRRVPITRRYRLGPEHSAVDKWDAVATAQGDVAVPADKDVKLTISGQAVLQDQSPLRNLRPDDLHSLEIYCPENIQAAADDRIMPHLSGLTGLKALDLNLPDLTDQGMKYLKPLTALEELWVVALGMGVTDAGFQYLEGMQSLQAFWSFTDVTDEGLSHVGRLSALRELSFNVTKVRGPGLTHLAQLPELEYVELKGADFGDRGLRYLHDLPALRSLRLRGEDLKISDAGMRYIGQLSGLEELRLVRFEGVTDAGLVYLKPLRSLRLLQLGKSATTDNALATLSEIQSLEDLTLSNNPRSVLTDVGLSYLPKLKRLRRLRTMGRSNAPITDRGLKHLGSISTLRELQVCGGSGITDEGIRGLSGLSQLESLAITTDSDRLTDKSLAYIGKLTTLRSLYLYYSAGSFTTSGLNELNGLAQLEFLSVSRAKHDDATLDWSGLTRLEDLSIQMTPLKDADLASLGKLTHLKRLQVLVGISDAGLAHLAGLTELQMLNMSGAKLTDEGLRHLESMKKLHLLSISGSFTDQGLESLEGLRALRILIITSAPPLSEEALARLQGKLPNLTRLTVRAAGG